MTVQFDLYQDGKKIARIETGLATPLEDRQQ